MSYGKNRNLGTQLWETPVGAVVRGMDTLLNLNHEYGDMPPWGKGPEQHKIHSGGLEYMEKNFPHLDKFLTCHVIHDEESEEEKEIMNENDGNDDMIDLASIKVTSKKVNKSLRSAEFHTSMSGYEAPILGVVAFVLVILIYVSKRRMRNHNKSL